MPPQRRGCNGNFIRETRMKEGKGLSLPGGMQGTEMSVEPGRRKPGKYDSPLSQEMMPLRTA